jgi:hypothetical protein
MGQRHTTLVVEGRLVTLHSLHTLNTLGVLVAEVLDQMILSIPFQTPAQIVAAGVDQVVPGVLAS